jgi:hypothetical protein
MHLFDTNSFRVIGNYYPDVFPSFWAEFNRTVGAGEIGSVREVQKELEVQNPIDHLLSWCDTNGGVFPPPSEEEMHAVAEIFSVEHFRQLIGEKQRLRGSPVADPFLVARARVIGATVVTEEALRPNAAKVPNVCQHFGIQFMDVRSFLQERGWRF